MLIVYVVPFVVTLALFLREYGLTGQEFRGWRSFKLLIALYWATWLVVLIVKGSAWFCGECDKKGDEDFFLFTTIGATLVIFSPLIVGSLFSSFKEIAAERTCEALGFFLLIGGYYNLSIPSG